MQATAWVIFLIGVLAPIAEEMLFRGAMFRKWRLRWGTEKVVLIVSGVFALGHANAPAVFLHALALTVLYTSTRTIWAPIAAHMLNNLIPLLLVHTADFLPTGVLEAAMDWRWHLAAAIPASLGAWWLVCFVRRGWHTLGDPVHGLPVTPDIGQSVDPRGNALAVDQPGS